MEPHHRRPSNNQNRGISGKIGAKKNRDGSDIKVTVLYFWNSRGKIHIDNQQKERVGLGYYCVNLFDWFNEILKEKSAVV